MNKMTKEERELYESDLKAKSDWNGGMDWAKKQAAQQGLEQGLEQGKLQEKIEIAKNLKKEGLSIELIAKTTSLSIEEIQEL